MSDAAEDKDVNISGDRVTYDHDAGLGSSAEDMETHNPDMADFDEVLSGLDTHEDDADDTSGGTLSTDDSDDSDDEDSGDSTTQDDDKDKPLIPRTRLNEVIAERDEERRMRQEKEVEWARKEAIFEGRLAALEKTENDESAAVDPFDEVLAGEPQDILNAFQEDPAGFLSSFKAQAKAEATAELNQRRADEQFQASLAEGLDKFSSEHEDFIPNTDKLIGIMNSNPIHNAISAYAYGIEIPALAAKLEEATKGVDDKIAAAKAEGISEGRKAAIKEIQAKGAANVLDGSQANQSGGQVNTGIETGGDLVSLKEKITANLLKQRAATGS